MPPNDDAAILVQSMYSELRRIAASDPRVARQRLVELVDSNDPQLDPMLELMRPASEGRMRQLVANIVNAMRHVQGVRDRFVPHLVAWQQTEPDEFTKPAISAALNGLDLTSYEDRTSGKNISHDTDSATASVLFSTEAIDIYRWVAGRLCHRVRNSLELPAACVTDAIHQATAIADDVTRANITHTLIEAQQALRQIGRVVDFRTDDEAFRWTAVPIITWLQRMTERYRSKHEPVTVDIVCAVDAPGPCVMANDVLLEIVFWNLCRNAAQEVQGQCVITAHVTVARERVSMLLLDNGPGLQPQYVSEAFSSRISTRGEERGRGLLEVADAMHQLQGFARVKPIEGRNRIELLFPLAMVSQKELR